MSMLARRDQRGAAVPIGAANIRSSIQRQLQDLVEAFSTCVEERGVLDVVLGIDVPARRDQFPDSGNIVGLCGENQESVGFDLGLR